MKIKNIAIFEALILVLSIITGIIYGLNNQIEIKEIITNIDSNYFLINTSIIFILFFLTLSTLGIIGFTIYFTLEGISSGYLIYLFYKTYKTKGLLCYLLLFISSKLIFIILVSYLFIISYKYTKRIINNITGKNKEYVFNITIPLIYKYTIVLIISLINNTLTLFITNKVINLISNML